jgi:hypothetical protein
VSTNSSPPSASAIEQTRLQAFKELRSLLSEVLASAVADEAVPEAFKSKTNWDKLIAQTEQRLAEGWKQRFEGGAERRSQPRALLDLLPDEEEQQQLLSERFVNEVSYQDRAPLDELDRQLAAISGSGFDDHAPNPLGPSAWVEGLRGGMRQIVCTPEERDWLMARLVPLLAARITAFYSGMTTRLASAGYGGRSFRAGSPTVASRGNEYSPDMVPTLGEGQQGFSAGGGGGSGGIGFSGGEGGFGGDGSGGGAPMQGDGSDMLDQLFGLLSARRSPGGFDGYGVPGGCYPGVPAGYVPAGFVPAPAGFVPGSGGFVPGPGGFVAGAMPGVPGGAGIPGAGFDPGSAGPAVPLVPWSQTDLFSILSLLQGSYALGPGAAAGASSVGRLHEAIGATANQLGLAGGIQAMPGPAQDMLELVSMLFEALLDGRRLDEKARSQLARLIIPYVRVALLDRRLFMQSSHPARRVLNLLVEALETAAPDVPHYRSLRDLAFTLIERIVEEFDDTLKLFELLEGLLATELDACRRRADIAERRAADAQSGKERRQLARTTVADLLSEAIVGKSLPSVLLDFLAGPWQHHHTVVLLREGALGEGVGLSRGLLDDLLHCNDTGALEEAARLRPVMVEVLASSGQPGSAADELLVELSLALAMRASPSAEQLADALTAATVEHVLVDSPQVIAEHTVLAPEAEPVDDSFLVSALVIAELPADMVERYASYPIGTWLDFVAEDGRVTSARISWTSPISGRRILSNRRGQRMLVASPEELSEMELEGRLRPRHSEAAFDQAMQTVTSRLQSSPNAA